MADVEKPVVDVNTDDLDQFTSLLSGTATQKPAEDESNPAETEEVDTEVEADEDDTGANEETDDTDPVDEPDGESEADPASEPEEEEDILSKPKPKKNKKSVQERINEYAAKAHEAERNAETERRLREALEAQLAAAKTQPKEQPKAEPAVAEGGPTPDDVDEQGNPRYELGEFDPKFIAELTKWTFAQQYAEAEAQRKQREAEEAESRQMQELSQKWEGRLGEAEKEIPDFRDTVKTLDSEFAGLDPQYGQYLASTIMQLDHGPQVLFYLANHVDEARKIAAAGPLNATLALGRIEEKVHSAIEKRKAAPVRKTQTKEPPTTTRGSGVSTSIKGDTDDLDKFEKLLFS